MNMLLQTIKSNKWSDTRVNIKFTLRMMWKYARTSSLLAGLLLILSAGGVYLQIYSIQALINAVVRDQSLSLHVVTYLILVVLSPILNQSINIFGGQLRVKIRKQLDEYFIPRILEKYSRLEYPVFEDKEYIETLQRISESPHEELISTYYAVLNMAASFITFIQIITIFLFTSIYLGLITLVVVIPTIYLDMKVAKREMMQYWHASPEIAKRAYYQQLFIDKSTLQEIKVFQNQDYFIDKSDEMTEIINRDLKRNIGTALKFYSVSTVLLIVYYGLFVFMLIHLLRNKNIGIGLFVALLTTIGNFYQARTSFAGSVSNITRLSQQVANLKLFLSLPEIKKVSKPNKLPRYEYLLEFDSVSFKYPNTEKYVLKDVSLKIKLGENVAFVGENGAGKSTLIKLLCGLYKPESGKIKIAGLDISEYSTEAISDLVSVVFQDSSSYDMTLRENVALGDVSEINNDQRIKETIRKLNDKNDSIANMSLEQKVGRTEDGSVDLSGGQWQRLAIARTLFSKHELLILDEPTAAQDPISESRLYELFYSIIKESNKSSIMISHRLASCRLSDRIYVLNSGTIDDIGTHRDLMNRNGLYADMFRKQSEWYLEEGE